MEPIKVVEANGKEKITPSIEPITMEAHTSYISSCMGVKFTPQDVVKLLERMSLHAEVSKTSVDSLLVQIPPTRPDIIHECDIIHGIRTIPNCQTQVTEKLWD